MTHLMLLADGGATRYQSVPWPLVALVLGLTAIVVGGSLWLNRHNAE